MDSTRIAELVAHYVAMLVLVFIVLGVVDAATGGVNFWLELAIIVVVVVVYRPIVTRLGVAPSAWAE